MESNLSGELFVNLYRLIRRHNLVLEALEERHRD